MRINKADRERAFYLYKKPVVWPGSYSSTNGRTLEQDQSRLPSFYLINTECPLFLIGKTFFKNLNAANSAFRCISYTNLRGLMGFAIRQPGA